ncbi:hypothetical protein EAX62_05810 [Tessaracoccus antarcticus]|uniref:WD40 repeat domain-containing protein n=2 Tax=Tessaracoccus antarcticus TaxID=2479848 RepID=A0A3M0GH87_9ACTN|nr:hypothetical protein EAX62_05810 [Tessaracoccus antarcticus]
MCALGLGGLVAAGPAFADDINLGDSAPTAITGLAWDEGAGEVILTDDKGSITAWSTSGDDERDVTFSGSVESVQALSMFDGMLYIGDIGDEAAARDFVTVFRVGPQEGTTNYRAWDFSYPEGPQDAKALAVSGKGRVYVVTGGDDPGIYRAGLNPSRTDVNELVRSADAPQGVTDAVFLDDGSTLMLRTATGVDLVDAFTWEVTASTTYVDAPADESITTFGERRMLVGGASPLRDEPLPDGRTTATPVPTTSPSPSQSADATDSPETTATATAEPGSSQTPTVSRRGTILALVAAGVVAVLAGVAVFVVRR